MATALIGHIEAFDPDTDDWPQYVERMEEMFKANSLTGESKAEKRHSSLLSLAKPATKMFEELTAVSPQHFSPPPSEVIQRYRFY